jgi:hypothetical protein
MPLERQEQLSYQLVAVGRWDEDGALSHLGSS